MEKLIIIEKTGDSLYNLHKSNREVILLGKAGYFSKSDAVPQRRVFGYYKRLDIWEAFY